jgi:hypothetical protein
MYVNNNNETSYKQSSNRLGKIVKLTNMSCFQVYAMNEEWSRLTCCHKHCCMKKLKWYRFVKKLHKMLNYRSNEYL